MPLALVPVAESKFYVAAPAPATFTAAGYGALTWTEVKGLDSAVSIGLMRESGNFDALAGGRQKYRTILDSPNPSGSAADLEADAGQILLAAAFNALPGATAENISMRSEKPTAKGVYARGTVVKWTPNGGGAGAIWLRDYEFLIDPTTFVQY